MHNCPDIAILNSLFGFCLFVPLSFFLFVFGKINATIITLHENVKSSWLHEIKRRKVVAPQEGACPHIRRLSLAH